LTSNSRLSTPRRYSLTSIGLAITLLSLANPAQTNQEAKAATKKTATNENVAVPEGRKAVKFYHDNTLPEKTEDEQRLSKDIPVYPVDPVDRLRPLLELGDPFLGNGPIKPGIKTPTGQVLQPTFLLFGSFRSAFQSFDDDGKSTVEWANRLNLNGNLNFSGTERLVFSLRPLDSRNGAYTGYSFDSPPANKNGWHEGFNTALTRLYFEGELGEIFPGLDPSDSHTYDLGFSVGRQLLQAQNGTLINDVVDSVGITRNSLVFKGISNLRITGLYGWDHINRGNNDQSFNNNTHSADLLALFTEADTALNNTVDLDLVYIRDKRDENAWYIGAASTQRLAGWLNSTFRINASHPENKESAVVGDGVLLFSQLSATLPSTDNLAYFNTFWNLDRYTSASRSPDQGTPVANIGLLYAPVGLGRYGVPLGQSIDKTVGTAIGYQMFLDGIDKQLIFELGARTSTRSSVDASAIGFGARYQQTIGKHHVLRLDSFVVGQERENVSYGVRTEWMVNF
jgi:hypothetical protein